MDSYRRQNPYTSPLQPKFLASLLGPLELVTAPQGQLLSLAEAKLQCRVDPDLTADDPLLSDLIDVAAQFAQKRVMGHRQLLTAVYDQPVTCWWGGWVGGFPGFWGSNYGVNSGDGTLELPLPPMQQVVQITYQDPNAVLQTLAPSTYVVRTPLRGPGEIDLAAFQVWPALEPLVKYPIRVRIVAGYVTQLSVNQAASTLTVVGGLTYAAGQTVLLSGSMPAPLVAGTTYFVVNPTAGGSTFQVAATSGGTAITLTGNPAGNLYAGQLPAVWKQGLKLIVGHWYRNREPGDIDDKVERALSNLLAEEGWGSYA